MTSLGTKTNSAVDYTYDNNGNLLKDRNKDIGNAAANGISYNHLNLPYRIWIPGKGTITYIYDATGNKLEKRTYDSTVSKATRTTYLGGYVYNNDTLQFFGHEEGRIRKKPDHSFVYDYFIKDHLGNTRVVLTEEYEQNTYPVATLEDGAIRVDTMFYNIKLANIKDTSQIPAFSSVVGKNYLNNNGNPPYNTNPYSVVTDVSKKMYLLDGSTNNRIGLGVTLKVMSGDNVHIYGKSYWHNTAGGNPANTNNFGANEILALLAGSNPISSAGKGATSGALTGSTAITTALGNWVVDSVPTETTKPKAYYNWILFDEQFRIVTESSGFWKVGDADILKYDSATVDISKNGYLYVYCSNESNKEVFFDNLQVIHNKGPLMEETHYYPYGLPLLVFSPGTL